MKISYNDSNMNSEVLKMGLFIATVLGFAGGILAIGAVIMFYFSGPMNNQDAIIVDPKPTNKF